MTAALAGPPTPADLAEGSRWAAAKLLATTQPARTPDRGLNVVSNHGPVQLNVRGSEPLRIGGKTYTGGLYCHAPSKLIVTLPAPAKSLQAEIGIDSRAGGGSVVFMVTAGEKERFRSDVKRIADAAQAIDVDLAGATSFILEATDAGDGITSDQANWADASVTLTDGSVVWLGDLPITDASAEPIDTNPPFSFVFNGKPSASLLPTWAVQRTTLEDSNARRHNVIYTDPESRLVARLVGVEWLDSPAIEWTIYFRNDGRADSAVLENIAATDLTIPAIATDDCALHYTAGDNCTPDSYKPMVESMPTGWTKRIANTGGRPTQEAFPYFNLSRGGSGVIVVIGWPGQWSADFSRASTGAIRVRAGQETTRFVLHPGEEVRGPRVVLLPYQGNWITGQNLWRRYMTLHNMPRRGGKLIAPMLSLCTGNYYPGLMSDAKQELEFLRQHIDAGIRFDNWWQDAGWYPCDGVTWPKTGTWEVERKRFPNGLREVSDYAHQHGIQSLVWFEPERVHADTWLADNHPEWIHGGKAGGLLKLSDAACRAWLTVHIDKLMTEQGIDNYRQDFNIDPLSYWRSADSPNRQGITEIRHVEAYLAYWDDLMKSRPDSFIDSCASGGRRNDIETMRRAVPLLRSDWYHAEAGQQCHTYGLAMWLPYQGTGFLYGHDKYWIRSSMVANLTFAPGAGGMKDADLPMLKAMGEEHRAIGDAFLGDFYTLTPYSQAEDVWMAWQYDRPEAGRGVVQAFRRTKSIYETARPRLSGLRATASYEVIDLDTKQATRLSGKALMEDGLPITLRSRPQATTIMYRIAG